MKEQTLGELRMCGSTKWMGWALYVFTRGIPLVASGESDTG